MGMFDYVKYKAPCYKCGTMIWRENYGGGENYRWQSKDADCELDTVFPQQVQSFYSNCPNKECDTWNEYQVIDADSMKIELNPNQ